jgi:hypothetical protein
MAQAKLWIGYSIIRVVAMGLLTMLMISCRADDKPIGMSLLFQSAGRPVGVQRFDPDGMRGPVPGAVRGNVSSWRSDHVLHAGRQQARDTEIRGCGVSGADC